MKNEKYFYWWIITVILYAGTFLFFAFNKNECNQKYDSPDNRKYLREIDSLDNLRGLSAEREKLLLNRIKIDDSLISQANDNNAKLKTKINENTAAIILLSADSTFKLFTDEITGDGY